LVSEPKTEPWNSTGATTSTFITGSNTNHCPYSSATKTVNISFLSVAKVLSAAKINVSHTEASASSALTPREKIWLVTIEHYVDDVGYLSGARCTISTWPQLTPLPPYHLLKVKCATTTKNVGSEPICGKTTAVCDVWPL